MVKKPAPRPVVETIPSEPDTVSALASANAPFIYFDSVPNFGFNNNVAHMSLEAIRYTTVGENNLLTDRVVVAHLRMSFPALQSLKEAIAGIELLAEPAAEGQSN